MNSTFFAELPFPISTNQAYRAQNFRVLLSARAREWRVAAFDVLARSPAVQTYTEPVEAILVLRRNYTQKCRRWDIDNHVKLVLDALTEFGVWEDDDLVHRLMITKETNKVPSLKVHGRGSVLVVVKPLES
jgi:crossover junction endodeoxyribonuclease RusA